jgi:hypothetical protein
MVTFLLVTPELDEEDEQNDSNIDGLKKNKNMLTLYEKVMDHLKNKSPRTKRKAYNLKLIRMAEPKYKLEFPNIRKTSRNEKFNVYFTSRSVKSLKELSLLPNNNPLFSQISHNMSKLPKLSKPTRSLKVLK